LASADKLASLLVQLADTRSGGHAERESVRIDTGRVTSSNPLIVKLNGLRLTLEGEDITTIHGYTPAVGHTVIVFPLYSGGFFVVRANA
jgi:hypothetical protein